jgi:hypothetical protein
MYVSAHDQDPREHCVVHKLGGSDKNRLSKADPGFTARSELEPPSTAVVCKVADVTSTAEPPETFKTLKPEVEDMLRRTPRAMPTLAEDPSVCTDDTKPVDRDWFPNSNCAAFRR